MTNELMFRMAFMAFSLMLAFNLGTFAQKVDCSTTTDTETVGRIYAKIEVKYKAQMNHINVTVKDGVVTLQGWATTKGVKKEIEKIAKKTACVKSVMNKLTIGVGGGCGPGEKPCGSICIPEAETCNIRTKVN